MLAKSTSSGRQQGMKKVWKRNTREGKNMRKSLFLQQKDALCIIFFVIFFVFVTKTIRMNVGVLSSSFSISALP